MFKCGSCRRNIGPGVASQQLAQDFVECEYPYRNRANHFYRKEKPKPVPDHWTIENNRVYTDDRGGKGLAATKFLNLCPACHTRLKPKEVTREKIRVHSSHRSRPGSVHEGDELHER